jgi:superfamily II DNA helicase RecQ
MPFTPITPPDPERPKITAHRLCEVFGIESPHPQQEEAGQNILKGISTFLDVPTGGSKTLAFWYALFYHWQPGNFDEDCQKIVLVVGPLVVLMEEQAKTLNEKDIPTIAITGNTPNLEKRLTVRHRKNIGCKFKCSELLFLPRTWAKTSTMSVL